MNRSFWIGFSLMSPGLIGLVLSRGDPNALGVHVALMLLGAIFLFVGLFPTVKYGIETLIGLIQLAIIMIGISTVLKNASDPISAVVEIMGITAISLVVGYVKKIVFRED